MQNRFEELKKISHDHKPEDLADMLTFSEGIHISCKMVNNEAWDKYLQEYATDFLEEIRQKYSKK